MASIHLNRAGQSLGQFTPAEVVEGFRTGKFQPSDLAWMSGQPEWRPLSELLPKLQADADPSTPLDAPPLPKGGTESPAWERRATIGFFPAIFESVQEILMQPGSTFSRMKTSGGLGTPLLYYMILGSLSTGIAALYQIALSLVDPSQFEEFPVEIGTPIFFLIGLLTLVFFVPLLVFMGAFIGSGLTHLMLLLVGGARKDFETTFRVVCYAYGTTSLFQIIPLCGSFIQAIYSIIVAPIGLSKAHEIEMWRALLAIFLPILFCCGLILVIILLAFGEAFVSDL